MMEALSGSWDQDLAQLRRRISVRAALSGACDPRLGPSPTRGASSRRFASSPRGRPWGRPRTTRPPLILVPAEADALRCAGSRLRRPSAALSAGRAHKLGGARPQGGRSSALPSEWDCCFQRGRLVRRGPHAGATEQGSAVGGGCHIR